MHTSTTSIPWPYLSGTDLVCFSHLRWNFVYQRPQHVLSRFAKHLRVFFIEEPIFHDSDDTFYINEPQSNVHVVVPHLKHGKNEAEIHESLKNVIAQLFSSMDIERYFSWYYTPMAMSFTKNLNPEVTVYDCMDELSAFKFAPPSLKANELSLLKQADVVFTGGYSIYESKKDAHHNIYPFPSSIDKEHFGKARTATSEPLDQQHIPHPRFGFFGVIDERLDIDLIKEAAEKRPDWQFIIIGPVVKIDPATLPRYSNIHYLGGKNYQELPSYLAGWDVALIPFALNESTRFISPTKTPEYLAAGVPVISTPIKDVVSPYGENKLVHIASNADELIAHGEKILAQKSRKAWIKKIDAFLSGNSWDRTWSEMAKHIETSLKASKQQKVTEKETQYV